MKKHFILMLAGFCGLLFTSCTTVPETGRKQVMLVSSSQETQLGLTSFEETKKETPVSKDPQMNDMLQRVGKRIAAVTSKDMPNAQWEFVVFQSDEANAFCLPGGKVGVYSGIFKIAKDEAGLATVVGHEVAHAVARHGAERMSEAQVISGGGSLLGAGLSKTEYSPMVVEGAKLAYGLTAKVGRELPHSRKQELEADQIGIKYMARAGYDPEAAVQFWERFAEHSKSKGGSGGMAFLRTHPLDTVRIDQLKKLLPEAKQEFMRSSTAKTVR
jgi:metalloendopeptidase OMA1, mitochondrial